MTSSIEELYKPIFYIHSDEQYYPCSVKYFVENSKLYDKITNELIDDKPTTSSISYANVINKTSNETYLKLNSDEFKYGEKNNLQEVPVYVHKKEVGNKTLLTYTIFYAYNGSKNVLFFSKAGEHYGDLEHVTVEIDNDTLKINRMYFGAHTTKEGKWADVNKLTFENGRPVVFIAINSHAMYYKNGTIIRLYGLGNDETNYGIKYDPPIEKIDSGTDWVNYTGRFGFDGPASLVRKSYFTSADPEFNSEQIIVKTQYINVLFYLALIIIIYIMLIPSIYGIVNILQKKYFIGLSLQGLSVLLILICFVALYYFIPIIVSNMS
jgi:hypothetical protein